MQLKRIKPGKLTDRRHHPRSWNGAMRVTLDGVEYQTTNWSASGFRVDNIDLRFAKGDTIRGQYTISHTDPSEFVAEIVWTDVGHSIGARFIEVNGRPIT